MVNIVRFSETFTFAKLFTVFKDHSHRPSHQRDRRVKGPVPAQETADSPDLLPTRLALSPSSASNCKAKSGYFQIMRDQVWASHPSPAQGRRGKEAWIVLRETG